jgi:hypothetical protein
MAENDFRDGSGEVSPGFTLSSAGGKHLLEKNAAILFGPPLLFSAVQVFNHTFNIEMKKKSNFWVKLLKSQDIIPGLTGRPSLTNTSFLTWTKIK